jgi:Tfp pilus assembly protein PilF
MLSVHACAGELATREGRSADAEVSYRHALEVEEKVRHPQHRASTLIKLGQNRLEQNRYSEAALDFSEAAELADVIGDRRVAINAILGFCRSLRLSGELAVAKNHLREALAKSCELGSPPQTASVLLELARAEHADGDTAKASRIASLIRAINAEGMGEQLSMMVSELALAPIDPLSGDVEELLVELVNERAFGAVRL